VIQFAAEPILVVKLRENASQRTILHRISSIQFTGEYTRIADAIELGLEEMKEAENEERKADKIFVLISDGHSLEYWHKVQQVGRELRSHALSFVASTSSEISFAEMLIYAGDLSRVFVGSRDKL
jgi:Mg-chelatase subunit ChlD